MRITWVTENPHYFITICAQPRGLNQLCRPDVAAEILQAIRYYHQKEKWYCHLALLMPDHIHLLLSFPDAPSFSRPVGEWKKWLVRRCQIRWQENFFDHRLRNEQQDQTKADYILQNPVRAGFVQRWEDWPYRFMPE